MKKLTIISILMMIFSLSAYAGGCGSISDISGSEISEPVIQGSVTEKPESAGDQ